ncbi:hypothetical protein [Rhodoferax sp.]|uniref:hypothetical protein n=1 Tax=Rhodoferax sp. TaxID=50421 RepID=UPI00374D6BDA
MQALFFIKSLFSAAEIKFTPGERVNLVRRGSIERTDGYVLAQTDKGVLVEWPRAGSSFVNSTELTAIV